MPKIANVEKLNLLVRFFCSATLELVSSLHVITDPVHHVSCLGWYESVIKTIDPKLHERILTFGKKYASWAFTMDIVDIMVEEDVNGTSIDDDFDEICSKIEQMDDMLFIYIFLGETLISQERDISRVTITQENIDQIDLNNVYPFIKKEDVHYFLGHLQEVKTEFLSILRIYHDSVFCTHWETFHHLYAVTVNRERKSFSTKLPLEYILSLHKGLVLENEAIHMKKEVELSLETEYIREVRLFFSMFTFPHLMCTVIGDTISIYENMIFPMMLTDQYDVLADSVKALSEVNRLAILRLISHNPTTNKELAQLLDITPASISQHLKILKDTNMITATRNKNNIDYSINAKTIADLFAKMNEFLDLNPKM
jgi:DNA-binding transcriptional ArsR family regulator